MELVRALHLLAMAFFVGGQLLLAVALVPTERRTPDRERMRAIARRFGWGTLVAIGSWQRPVPRSQPNSPNGDGRLCTSSLHWS